MAVSREPGVHQRPPLFALITVTFLSSLGFSIVMPFLVYVVTGFGGNALVMGLLGTAFSLAQFVGAPWLGGLSDRVGRKRVLLASQLGGLVAWLVFLGALFAPHVQLAHVHNRLLGDFIVRLPVALIALSRALDGFMNGSIAVANAYLTDATRPEERQAGFAKLGAASSLGLVFGPLAAGYIAQDRTGIIALVIIATALSAAGALVVWRYLPPLATTRAAAVSAKLSLRDAWQITGAKTLIAFYFLTYVGFSVFVTVLPVHVLLDLHWETHRVGQLFGVLSVALVVTQAASPRFARFAPNATLAAIGSLLVAIGYAIVAGSGGAGAFVAVVLYGVGNGIAWPAFMALLSQTGAAESQGRLQGVASSSGSIASVLGMIAGGLAFDRIGQRAFGIAVVALLFAAFTIVPHCWRALRSRAQA